MGKTINNIIKICLLGLGVWFFCAIITPFLEDHIPALKQYNKIQDEQNLDSGALYYTNVPQVQEAEENTRRATREAMRERREALTHKQEKDK